MHPVFVYLDPSNYNINFEVSRSFFYKCLHKFKVAITDIYDSPHHF